MGETPITESRIIRDFVYLDLDSLYSFYAQTFEGVTQQILVSRGKSSAETDTIEERAFSKHAHAAEVAEATLRTDSKVLLDHMYALLEAELQDSILDAMHTSSDELPDRLEDAFLVRVSGRAEIHDYEKLVLTTTEFNDLIVATVSLQLHSEENKALVSQIESAIASEKNTGTRRELQLTLKRLKDPKEFFKQEKMGMPQEFLDGLRKLASFFHGGSIEVAITPSGDGDSPVFRGILDKRHLRISSDYLHSLYSGAVSSEWTMVGQVARTPAAAASFPSAAELSGRPALDDATLRDAFRNLFQGVTAMFVSVTGSARRNEVVIRPLAIYRQYQLPRRHTQ